MATITQPNISNADLRAMMDGKDPKPTKVEDKPETSATVEETEEKPEVAQETTETEPKKKPEGEHDTLPSNAQKRLDKEIARAVSARKEAEDILAKLKAQAGTQGSEPVKQTAPPKAEGKPKRPVYGDKEGEAWNQYETRLAEYEDARDEWVKQQARAEFEDSQKQQRFKTETDKVWEKARKDFSNFDEAREAFVKATPEPLQLAMSQFDNWPAIAVHYEDQAAELDTLVRQFKANPTMAIVTLADLSKSLKPTSKAKAPAEELPEPFESVGGNASAVPKRACRKHCKQPR